MNRILIACAAVALGAGVALAASPEVDKAIKAVQAVGADAAKMKMFCDLVGDDEDNEEEAAAGAKAAPSAADKAAEAKEDAAADKEEDALVGQLGSGFKAAWDAGGKLDENSADGKEYGAAVDAVAAKCE